MLIRMLAGSGLGMGIGALMGYFGKCSSGACPLTANPWRGAFFGLLLGVAFAFSFSPGRDPASAVAAVAAEKIARIDGIASFKRQVETADGPVFVKFYAPWCGWCRRLEPIVEKLATEYKDRMKFVKVDTDEQKKIASRWGVSGLPTMLIFKRGKRVERIAGYRDEKALRAVLEKHAGKTR